MIIDCISDLFKWMCSDSARNLGELLKGLGFTGIAIVAWLWLFQVKKWM